MKSIIFILTLAIAGSAHANMFGTIAKCIRTDNIGPDEIAPSMYIMTSDFESEFSLPSDGLLVVESTDDFVAEIGSPVLAFIVDIVKNADGSFTVIGDNIFGDNYTFKEGEVVENVGTHSTFSCEMSN